MAELGRRPDRPDASDDQPVDPPDSGNPERAGGGDRSGTDGPQPGDRTDQGRDRPRVPGYSRADAFRNPTINELFAATEDPAFAPPEERARLAGRDRRNPQTPPEAGTDPARESRASELAGLHDRAATDRAELHSLRSDGDADTAQDGPTGSDDPERGSDDDRTDRNAPPADRPETDDQDKPADASGGDGRDGDGPKNPPPDDPDPDEGDSPDDLAAAKARIAKLEKQLEDKDAELKENQESNGRLENTCGYLDKQRKDANARADAAEARADALTGEVTELRNTVTEQSTQIETLTGTVGQLKGQVGELAGKLDEQGAMFIDALKQLKSPEQAKADSRVNGSDQTDEQRLVAPDAGVPDGTVGRALDGVEQRTSASETRDDRLSREPKQGRGELYTAAGGAVTSVGSFAGAGVAFLGGIPDVTAMGAVGGAIGLAAGAGSAVLAAVAFTKKWRRDRNEN